MVRTRADNTARKAVAAKAPRKALSAPSPRANLASPKARSSGSKGKNRWAGGNPIVKREIPEWQKPIDMFLNKTPSKSKEKENEVPESDDIVEIGQSSKDVEAEPCSQDSGTSEGNSHKEKDDLMDSDDDE